jgi:CRP/FNR family transcriptional regulator, cyclic AMP receptor protein
MHALTQPAAPDGRAAWTAAGATVPASSPAIMPSPHASPDPHPPTADLAAVPETLRPLAARGERKRFRKGALLLEEGEQGDTLFVILQGRVKAFSAAPPDRFGRDPGREITFGIYGAGEYVGEMSLDGGPRSASVVALEPTLCAVLTRRSLREHIAEHPDFAFELLARVIRRARGATRNARSLALLDVYGRLTLLLDELSEAQPDGTRWIDERLTHAETASRLGCSREMVSRLMKDLIQGGYARQESAGLRLLKALPSRW